MAFDLDGYVDVAERIGIFRDKYPDGSLQPVNPERPYWVETIGDRSFICYAAAAYRHPEDRLPGVGVAWEPFPGPTPYTKDSELMNAETSAWGRAIVAALAADTKKVASAQEVRNRRGGGGAEPGTMPSTPTNRGPIPATGPAVDGAQTTSSGPRPASAKQRFALERLIEVHGPPDGCEWPLAENLSMRQASGFLDVLKALPEQPAPVRVGTLRAGGSGEPVHHPGADDDPAESPSATPDPPAPSLVPATHEDLPDLSEYDGSPF